MNKDQYLCLSRNEKLDLMKNYIQAMRHQDNGELII